MGRDSGWFEKTRWLPLAFVVVSLALLLVVPIVVEQRTRELQRVVDAANRARVLVNDLEAAGATEVIIATRPKSATGTPQSETTPFAMQMARDAQADARELDSLLREIAPELREGLSTLVAVERVWHDAKPGDGARLEGAPGSDADPIRFLAAGERLDEALRQRLDVVRGRSRQLQRINFISSMVLTPIAMLSVLAVLVAWRRSQVLAHRLAAERAALAASMSSRAALVRGITHDLKNPLGAARGYADLLLDGVGGGTLSTEQGSMVARMRKLLDESITTISSLLDLARVDSDDAPRVQPRPVDLAALVGEVIEDYRAAIAERGLVLEVESSREPVTIVTDALQVRHILGNLLSNAVKYTPSPGTVRIVIGRPASREKVLVAVCDSGRGIPAEQREAVFQEFVRLPGAEQDAPGNGLGLAISRRLARLLGGDLMIGDAPEGGAMFQLVLPLTPAPQRHTAGSSIPSTHTE